MKCPNCNTEVTQEGTNIRCPACGVFHQDDSGAWRSGPNPDGGGEQPDAGPGRIDDGSCPEHAGSGRSESGVDGNSAGEPASPAVSSGPVDDVGEFDTGLDLEIDIGW